VEALAGPNALNGGGMRQSVLVLLILMVSGSTVFGQAPGEEPRTPEEIKAEAWKLLEEAKAQKQKAEDSKQRFEDLKERLRTGDVAFRKARWAMSPDDIAKIEGSDFQETVDGGMVTYFYKRNVVGLDSTVAYRFVDDVLVSGAILVEEAHSNKNDYIDDYFELRGLLATKYGPPASDGTEWRHDLFRDDPQEYGTAVSVGHLEYSAIWSTPISKIVIVLSGENYDVNLIVRYMSIHLQDMELDEQQEGNLDEI
jgi:hypothetical protein